MQTLLRGHDVFLHSIWEETAKPEARFTSKAVSIQHKSHLYCDNTLTMCDAEEGLEDYALNVKTLFCVEDKSKCTSSIREQDLQH